MLRRAGQYFLIYSFLGWMLEGCYNWVVHGRFQKPNFLHGPVKPMYGFGGVLLAGSYKYDRKHFYYNCCLLPLLVEFCSGLWLEHKFQLKYWDYSKEFLQLGGYICFRFALCWIVLAQLLARWVHPLLAVFLRYAGGLRGWKLLYRLFLVDCLSTIYQRRRACRHNTKSAGNHFGCRAA